MEFKVGHEVQAVDELGRWEEGKSVESIRDEHGPRFVEKCFGWRKEFNVTVGLDQIRHRSTENSKSLYII